MLQQEQVNELIQKSERGETTLEEETLLLEWIDAHPENLASLARSKNLDVLIQQWVAYEQMSTDEAKEKVWARWQQEKGNKTLVPRWMQYAAAAVVVLIAGGLIYKAMMPQPAQQGNLPAVAQVDTSQTPSPGTNKAILYPADKKPIVIADTTKGYVATQDNLELTKAGGVIYCKTVPGKAAPKAVSYLRVETPKGGHYQLVLPDGSKVWLNAASRLQWATVDTGNQRRVYLEGEAYFEVVHNDRRPFIVRVNDGDIEATGTHFNISSYPNEGLTKVTLTEGGVSVRSGGKEEKVPLNYSAIFSKGGQPRVEKEDNIDKIIAWTNGQFLWERDSLTTALREIERSYNVKVEYIGPPPATIVNYVLVGRNKPLDVIMGQLTINDVGDTIAYYKLEGRTLFVSKNRLPKERTSSIPCDLKPDPAIWINAVAALPRGLQPYPTSSDPTKLLFPFPNQCRLVKTNGVLDPPEVSGGRSM